VLNDVMPNTALPNQSTGRADHKRLPTLVLLHGWGCDSRIWAPLLPYLREYNDVITLDLPSIDIPFAGTHVDLEAYIDALLAHLPEQGVYIGWSLGGMLATALAARYPSKVTGLITLAANLQFVATPQWPCALASDVFDTFYQSVCQHPRAALKRFYHLQTQGDSCAREQLQWLRSLTPTQPLLDHLESGLMLLRSLDNRECLARLTMPGLHLFGEKDTLVPIAAIDVMRAHHPAHHYQCVSDVGHLLHYPHTVVAPIISRFLASITEQGFTG